MATFRQTAIYPPDPIRATPNERNPRAAKSLDGLIDGKLVASALADIAKMTWGAPLSL